MQHYGKVQSLERSASAFGDVSYNLTDSTKIYGGLRVTYDQVKQKLTEGTSVFGANTNLCAPDTDPEEVKDTSVHRARRFATDDHEFVDGLHPILSGL